MRLNLTLMLACVALTAAACDNETTTTTTPTPAPAPTNPPNNPQTQTVELTAVEFSFSPSQVSVKAGSQVRFVLHNGGTMQHGLELEMPSGDVEMEGLVDPGGMGTLDATMPSAAGDFDFYCPVAGHRQLGMEGTISVEPGPGTSDTDS